MTPREWIREHPRLSGLAVALAACVVVNVALWVHLGNVRARAARQRAALERMEDIAEEYAAFTAWSAQGVRYLRSPAGLSLSVVMDLARKKGVGDKVRNPKLRPMKHEGGLLEQVVSMDLSAVRREDLSMFLLAVQALDPAIRTKELRIAAAKSDPKLVDAKVTFSAYEAPVSAKK